MADGLQCCACSVLCACSGGMQTNHALKRIHVQVLQELQAKQQLKIASQPAAQLSALFAGPKAAKNSAAFSFGFL